MDQLTFHYHPSLIFRCYWEWRRSGYKHWPNIHEVANRDIDFSNDMMTMDKIVCTLEARVKTKAS